MAFHDGSKRQELTAARLNRLVGPGATAFFKDACRLMEMNPPLESTTHLVGHLLREIESALRAVLKPVVAPAGQSLASGKPCGSGDSNHRKQIEAILAALDIGLDERVAQTWLALPGRESELGLHRRAHRHDLAPPRSMSEAFKEFWEEIQAVLSHVLDRFEAKFLNIMQVLDTLLAKPRPNGPDVDMLRLNVPNNAITLDYFFARLEHPGWLEPLSRTGWLTAPSEPEMGADETPGGFRLWSPGSYLVRMAKLEPRRVVDIGLGIATRNPYVHYFLAEVALAVNPDLAAEMVPMAIEWLETYPDEPAKVLMGLLQQWVAHLANGAQAEPALKLARSLLAIRPRAPEHDSAFHEPDTRLGSDYGYTLEKLLPGLVSVAGMETLGMLCELLEQAIEASHQPQDPWKECDGDDGSRDWQKAIEDHYQNWGLGSGVRSTLVRAIRDTTEQLIKDGRIELRDAIRDLEVRPWLIFQRLSLHLLRSFPDAASDLVAARLTDRALIDPPLGRRVQHEYALLLREQFPRLIPEHQSAIFSHIAEGPNLTIPGQSAKWGDTRDILTQKITKQWQADRLALIVDHLPKPWRELYGALVEELGPVQFPEFESVTEDWSGPTSPMSTLELGRLSNEQMLEFLHQWTPSDEPLSPSAAGLSDQLIALVVSEPQRLAAMADQFRGLEPSYIRGLFAGLGQAKKEGRAFLWPSVLLLSEWVLSQNDTAPSKTEGALLQSVLRGDTSWHWTRMALADLISSGLRPGAGEIEFILRETVWLLLARLAEDPDPADDTGIGAHGGLDRSFNSTRGKALHGVMDYLRWARRHIDPTADEEQRPGPGFAVLPEARSLLERHLDPQVDPSLSIRAVFGANFSLLATFDTEWIRSQVVRLFPGDTHRELHDSAWASFITHNRPSSLLFELVHDTYREAIDRLPEAAPERSFDGTLEGHLVEHLMFRYASGKASLDSSGDLVRRFFDRASDAVRSYALEYFGRVLYFRKEVIEAQVARRLQTLWEWRLDAAQTAQGSAHRLELSAFGWWFASGVFAPSWSLQQLDAVLELTGSIDHGSEVLARLADLASTMPEPTFRCLRRIVEERLKGSEMVFDGESIAKVLGSILMHDSLHVHKEAEALVNRLAAHGAPGFRSLLEEHGGL